MANDYWKNEAKQLAKDVLRLAKMAEGSNTFDSEDLEETVDNAKYVLALLKRRKG